MKKLVFALTIGLLFTTFSYAQSGNSWSKKNYAVTGNWSVETIDGKHYLVLHDNFKTSKGPDLKLFLSKKSAQSIGKSEAVEKQGIFIAELKSHKGGQKYVIPSNIKFADFKSLVIHCEKYTKVWAASAI